MSMFIRSLFISIFVLLCAKLNHCMEIDFCIPIHLDQHSLEKYLSQRGERMNDQQIIFKINAFTQEFYLNLIPDSNFLATNIPAADSESSAASELRRCFYSGDVNADQDSYAALSICKGVHGAFSYQGMEYFISQIGNEGTSGYTNSFEGMTHVIRRRGRANSSGNPANRCGVGGLNPNISGSLEKYKPMKELRIGSLTETVLKSIGRSKRFASIPRFVEVLIVADESMAKFHGDDLKHYLLTLMSVAARLYKHPSILNSINIVVVGFMVISEADKGPKVTSNAALTLRNFCSWQKKLNKHSDKHPDYWDTAILFTKQVRREDLHPPVSITCDRI